jgi:nicotinamidase-related amidase
MNETVDVFYQNLMPDYNKAAAKPALLIIDFTDPFVGQGKGAKLSPLQNAMEKAVASTRFLSDRFHEKFPGVRQIWVADTEIVNDPMDIYSLNRREVLAKYTGFRQKDDDAVFVKPRHSAFDGGINIDTGESLGNYLRREGVGLLFVCGGTITQCVRETSIDAVSQSFNVVCFNDCIEGGTLGGSLGKERERSIEELWHQGVSIMTAREMMQAYGIDVSPLDTEKEALDARLPKPPTLRERISGLFGRKPS